MIPQQGVGNRVKSITEYQVTFERLRFQLPLLKSSLHMIARMYSKFHKNPTLQEGFHFSQSVSRQLHQVVVHFHATRCASWRRKMIKSHSQTLICFRLVAKYSSKKRNSYHPRLTGR